MGSTISHCGTAPLTDQTPASRRCADAEPLRLMGDTSTTVGWICVGPSHLQATRAHLEDPQVDDAASNLVGSIGGAEVIVVGVPTLASLRTRDAWTRLQAAASRAGKQRIDGVIITSTLADPQPSALPAPGDVVISPCSGGGGGHGAAQSSLADILRRALHVLRSEMGEDGRWLAPGGVRPGPRLHYLESFEDECLKEVAAYIPSSSLPTIAVFEAGGTQRNQQQRLEEEVISKSLTAGQHAASYARELIVLMTDPTVRSPPHLEGTERVVPPCPLPPPSQMPLFPRYSFPQHGDAVLLVVPTANKGKTAIFQECLADSAPRGIVVHIAVVPADSEVGEQPYNAAGLVGACCRIRNALTHLGGKSSGGGGGELVYDETFFDSHRIGTVLAASIENYILLPQSFTSPYSPSSSPSTTVKDPSYQGGSDRPTDFGVVVIHNATTGRTAVASSSGVTMDPRFVRRAKRFGSDDGDPDHGRISAGVIVAARGPTAAGTGIDKADWHRIVVGRSRYDLLRDAVADMQVPW